jgi:phenylacetate-CoA ligase
MSEGKAVPPGVSGQVVVTDLNRFATPIIRYSGLHDLAVMKDGWGSCKFKSPMLELIEGRMVDSIILPDGRIVSPYTLILLILEVPFIERFQIIQEQMDEITILLVKERSSEAVYFDRDNKIEQEIIERFKKVCGDKVKIQTKTIQEIPESFRQARVISRVKKNTFL